MTFTFCFVISIEFIHIFIYFMYFHAIVFDIQMIMQIIHSKIIIYNWLPSSNCLLTLGSRVHNNKAAYQRKH